MRRTLKRLATAVVATVVLLSGSRAAWCQVEGLVGHLREFEAQDTAIEAYIYGYPLVTMEMTRRVMTNVAAPEGTRAPWGNSSECERIRALRSRMSPLRMPTPST